MSDMSEVNDDALLAGILRRFIDMNNHGRYVGYMNWSGDHVTVDATVTLTDEEARALSRADTDESERNTKP